MANVLRGALADSGMFYEAHQAQWLADERPLAALLREPQSRLPPLAADGAAEATPAGMPQLRELPVHRDALTMVRQQLETLETQHVVWQGSLWPGQTIEWQVGEAPTQESATDDGREWRSHLRLTLPRLGGVEATLLVSALGVRVSLRAETETSAAMLDQNRRSLRTALTDAGVTPLSIGVLHAGA
jgi:hypothetical protein